MKILMAYPAKEEFALSSLGYLWLSNIAKNTINVDTIEISTDNCNINIKDVDAIAFSLSFDFDFMGVFEILEKLGIPFYKKDRDSSYPLIFAGGPVITTNSRPYELIFDFMSAGDGETEFKKILEIIKKYPKKDAIEKLKDFDGIIVDNRHTKKITSNLESVIYTPTISEKSYFKNTFIIELSRGCMNRCAFCTASYINLPYRNYEYEKIVKAINLGLKKTNKIALLGAQISAHPKFNEIISYIKDRIESGENIEFGISSLRTDAVTPELIKTLVLGGQKHSTIAIEAASEKLRKFINKNLTENQILEAVKICRENGLKGLKIYSMIGLPHETDDDIKEFLRLAKKLKESNKGFSIEFSFSTFVPKPHTPLQWSKREDTKTLETKQKYLEKEFAKLGIQSKFSSAKWDYWQTVISRSGNEITPLLEYVYRNSGKIGTYKKGVRELNIDISKSIEGFNISDNLPWDNVEIYPTKELLIKELMRLENIINKKNFSFKRS